MRSLTWPTIALLLIQCGPLVPTRDQITDNSGKKSVIRNDDAIVLLAHTGKIGQQLVFNLEIENLTEDTIYLGEEHIRYFASNKPFIPVAEAPDDWQRLSTGNSQLPLVMQYATSSDEILSTAMQQIRKKQTMGLIFTLLATGLTAYDFAKDSEDFNKAYLTEGEYRSSIARDVAVTSALVTAEAIHSSAFAAGENYDNLFYELLPDRPVLPFGRTEGNFYLSTERVYRYYRIVLQIRRDFYVFDFSR